MFASSFYLSEQHFLVKQFLDVSAVENNVFYNSNKQTIIYCVSIIYRVSTNWLFWTVIHVLKIKWWGSGLQRVRVAAWLYRVGRGEERMSGGRRVGVGSEREKGVRPHAKKMEVNVGSLRNFTTHFSLNIDSFWIWRSNIICTYWEVVV